MVGIQGIGGVPEPKSDRPANVRERDNAASTKASGASDGVVISSEAQAAASIARSIDVASVQPEVRSERVEAAREAIERGDYQKPDIVAEVANRINKFL